MARKNRQAEGLNLAFLDIMSCGLGAVILVFMLVKQNIESSPSETENLKKDISSLEQARDEAQKGLDELSAQLKKGNIDLSALSQSLQQQRAALDNKNSEVQTAQSNLDQLKKSITEIKVPKKEDLVETQQVNEENYLLGLKMEGKKIAVLVDVSTSMTNEKLLDIIRTKSSSDQTKISAAKWQRTKRVVAWLLARAPKNSQIAVIAFSEQANQLGGTGWMSASGASVSSIMSSLNQVVPTGATNLQQGLVTVNKLSPTDIYVITDGLPTKGDSNYKSLNPFSGCSSLTSNAKTISGECRKRLFRQTINESGLTQAKKNVILLPLEGDPEAAYEYWAWASSSDGLLISPASNWP
ncbi:VWA domain-containing protein [Methylophaga sp.]|uniref:VWA domain-containing protein n=1 Tax=Methylophaga sp. TaxID=2024840 RepID=UPI003A93407A